MPSWALMTKISELADPEGGGAVDTLEGWSWGCRRSRGPTVQGVGQPGEGLGELADRRKGGPSSYASWAVTKAAVIATL